VFCTVHRRARFCIKAPVNMHTESLKDQHN
jgi:hypothetical protein